MGLLPPGLEVLGMELLLAYLLVCLNFFCSAPGYSYSALPFSIISSLACKPGIRPAFPEGVILGLSLPSYFINQIIVTPEPLLPELHHKAGWLERLQERL